MTDVASDRWLTDRFLRLPDGTFPHLGIKGGGDVAEVALLSGSPERVELMAGLLDGAERVGAARGYTVYTGTYGGARLSVATSGVGSPSMSIAVEELGACGVHTFIRVGSCAASNFVMGPTPLRPARRLSQASLMPLPTGETMPRPVTTTLRFDITYDLTWLFT